MVCVWSSELGRLLPTERFGDEVVHHLGGAAADAQDARVAVVALDLAVAHVTGAAVQLHGFVDDEVARRNGLVLRDRGLGEQALLTSRRAFEDVMGIDTR